jgi:hypothetical protein
MPAVFVSGFGIKQRALGDAPTAPCATYSAQRFAVADYTMQGTNPGK